MTTAIAGRDFLRVRDLSAAELMGLLDRAADAKAAGPAWRPGSLAGRSLALVFEKPSLRTKSSFVVGAGRLGLSCVTLDDDEVALGRRESAADVARVLSRFHDAIAYRTHGHERAEELARHATVPVVNALSSAEHPCQALADLLTLRERFGDLWRLRLAWIGDGNNVCNSLIAAAGLVGASIGVATPADHAPEPEAVSAARADGAEVTLTRSPREAARGAHAVVTDTWISMGQEAEAARRREAFAGFRVDAALMAAARPEAVFLHCLPAHRGEEVTDEVLDSPASLVFEQAENRLHVQVALLAGLLGVP